MKKVVLFALLAAVDVTCGLAQKPVTMGSAPTTTTPTQVGSPSTVTMGSKPAATTPTQVGSPSAVRMGTRPAAAGPATAAVAANPCAAPGTGTGLPTVRLGNKPDAPVAMKEAEYKMYTEASAMKDSPEKAAAFEAYLAAYPESTVNKDTLQQMMYMYSAAANTAKTLETADKLLAIDPCNFYAEVFEVQLTRDAADNATDPAAKQALFDKATVFARQGLASQKPKATSAADWTAMKITGYPIFYSAIGAGALNKKDNPAAIRAFYAELYSVPVKDTEVAGPVLVDTYYLAQAYYSAANPDYLNCAYYSARAAFYSAEPYKKQFTELGAYCYRKYHGAEDGYDAVTAVAKDNLTPPKDFAAGIKPAPKPIELVKQLVDTTPDLSTLALSDKEFALQYGNVVNPANPDKKTYADQVFEASKGKATEIPDATVLAATADQITVAWSAELVESKTPEFVFTMKAPLETVPAVGSKITLDGTFASYTSKPVLIAMVDGEVVVKKPAPAKKAPVRKR